MNTDQEPADAPAPASDALDARSAPTKLDRPLLLIASVVVLGTVMSILDATVVNVAINTLATEFDSPLTSIQWVVTGYTLALATVIPLTAWSSNRFGTKRVYMTSIALFVFGSVLAGIAWSSGSLILFRVLQGFGGGLLMPVGMVILTSAAGPQRLGRVMAVVGIPMLLGPIAGPILGGWLVDSFSWRWIFFINVPIGILALLLAIRLLPDDGARSPARLDIVGLALLSPGLALLIYGVAEFGSKRTLAELTVSIPIALGVVLLGAFIAHAFGVKEPLIDLRLFANKIFAGANASLALVVIAVFGGMLLVPLYLQFVRGENALASGLLMAPQGLGAVVAMPIGGILADRMGVGKIVPVGLAVIAGVFAWLTQITDTTSYTQLCIALFGLGIGLGLSLMPTITGALQTLPRSAIAAANTTVSINQQIGTSIGTSVLSVILANAMTTKLLALGGGSTPDGAPQGGGLADLQKLPDEDFAAITPTLAESFGVAFTWALGFVVVAFVVALVALPKRKPKVIDDQEPGTQSSGTAFVVG